jgi:LCP family protein required for cell wall assembly
MGTDRSAQTEAMIVASLDPTSQTIDLLSIPGNLWVTIPGYGQGRIADAYSEGGPHLALLTMESVVRVPIPYYAVTGSRAFQQVVDALGGVTLGGNQRGSAASKRLAPLNGARALAFLRESRTDGGNQVESMRRQQDILLALRRETLQPQTFFQLPTILNALGGTIATNFPYNQVPALAHILALVPESHIHTTMLDSVDGAVTGYGGNLVGDWQRIGAIAHRLFPASELRTGVALEVLNGTPVTGEAASLTAWLRAADVRVRSYDSANSFDHPRTEVVMRPGATSPVVRVARDVAALLQAPLVTGSAQRGEAPIVVLIGRDFQDPSQQ